MKRLLPFALALFAATMFFTACGDDDSSSFVEPEKESSSSEILSSGDGTSDGNGDKSSSSVSSSTTNSSSSAKSNSSTGDKNSGGESSPASSSVKSSSSEEGGGDDLDGTSSSSEVVFICEEGETRRNSGVREVCQGGYWVPASSSSAVPTSSYFDMTEQFNEKVSYGEFSDPRDGQKYRTVELKKGVFMESYTVFAENLNYGKMVSGGSVQGDSSKYCYDDDPWYCENGWGGLYTWSRAMNFPAVCDSVSIASEKCPNKFNLESDNEEFNGKYYFVQHQGICPEGWHIMNENEWVEISEKSSRDVALYMGSKVAGFGNNSYGLSILPAGYWLRYENNTTLYKLIKVQTFFWSPQQSNDYPEKAHLISIDSQEMARLSEEPKSKRAFSVRCVKNY
ncbi:FISUMP domain-containing protein [Fibrobacter sp. HC4]|uniref:FISUMP domain-containing protein n=1 Tax=Fibrobacter sp. HC4 TaxID=3239812 RepID=UPI002018B702|nr:FISUMP domain-containing protein [Fibrobacter succinogenes]MCL4102455.1 hypothetical protein [Fibrobacter succinogenes]